MCYKIFVDGREGTTGLKIIERLEGRKDVELLLVSSEMRRDVNERKRLINQADFIFLCLPDDAARESVSLIENDSVRVIDASTAHRISEDWTYGFPELFNEQYGHIRNSKRVAVPGCYASGFVALAAPLVRQGLVHPDYPVTSFAISGYSGGGKATISEYESPNIPESFYSPRLYALSQWHKHLPEMQKYAGLNHPPVFNPIIDDYYCGMLVNIPLVTRMLPSKTSVLEILDIYKEHYKNRPLVSIASEDKFLPANGLSGKDCIEIYVNGDPNNERLLLTARLDNLGKGASGAAVQCLNVMMGIDEATGLNIK
ncbi:MAG: N-acetyl-gamma-glutamyl-phosphate reductase [Eubacterium sp.]|jgi:N-acetyl-gamma-glutamyl-phosphate reductase|nr:N-acetyl-gamma-glutamyl-phosphate reductase [Eubacterium sp.]